MKINLENRKHASTSLDNVSILEDINGRLHEAEDVMDKEMAANKHLYANFQTAGNMATECHRKASTRLRTARDTKPRRGRNRAITNGWNGSTAVHVDPRYGIKPERQAQRFIQRVDREY